MTELLERDDKIEVTVVALAEQAFVSAPRCLATYVSIQLLAPAMDSAAPNLSIVVVALHLAAAGLAMRVALRCWRLRAAGATLALNALCSLNLVGLAGAVNR